MPPAKIRKCDLEKLGISLDRLSEASGVPASEMFPGRRRKAVMPPREKRPSPALKYRHGAPSGSARLPRPKREPPDAEAVRGLIWTALAGVAPLMVSFLLSH
jgi:hypothetical protein